MLSFSAEDKNKWIRTSTLPHISITQRKLEHFNYQARFQPQDAYVGFMVDKLALKQVFLPILRFPPDKIIPKCPNTITNNIM
jgi:hypothetical protein